MRFDFTASQVMLCEVSYTLEEFLRDLHAEVKYNFPQYSEQKLEEIAKLFYRVMYFSFNGRTSQEIAHTIGIKKDFADLILKDRKGDVEMLGSVIMGKFLRNVREAGGLLSDCDNLDLVNAEVRNFHALNNL